MQCRGMNKTIWSVVVFRKPFTHWGRVKCPPFHKLHFVTYFPEWKLLHLIQISLRIVPKLPVNKTPALFQIMACWQSMAISYYLNQQTNHRNQTNQSWKTKWFFFHRFKYCKEPGVHNETNQHRHSTRNRYLSFSSDHWQLLLISFNYNPGMDK